MKSAAYMTGACVASWLIGVVLFAPEAAIELLAGMALPLVMAAGTMTLVERTCARDPRQLTPLMMKAFGAKMVLVGAYVAAVLGVTPLDPVPFAASFFVYFIGLHLTETVLLRSVFAGTVS